MQALFELLARFPQPLLIIGGHALAAHGVARQTVDVDCLVAMQSREGLDTHLRQGGFQSAGESENFARYTHPSDFISDIDLLFVNAATFEKLQAGSLPLEKAGVTLRAPALSHLIALKLHAIRNAPSREVGDLGDIARLLQANPGAIAPEELAALCEQFGPPGIFSRLEITHP